MAIYRFSAVKGPTQIIFNIQELVSGNHIPSSSQLLPLPAEKIRIRPDEGVH